MKKWKMLNESGIGNQESEVKYVIKILLENRGLKTKKEIDGYLNPKLEDLTIKNVGIDNKQLQKAINRIRKAIKNKEQIVVFGDYDVDGICGTAILWETLNGLDANVLPYIPHRVDEGYGLSETGIKNLKLKIKNCGLIITVDNGIVANSAVEFANKQGIDVVITDHHVPSNPSTGSGLPKAFAIVHTTKLCGAGVAYLLAEEIKARCHSRGNRVTYRIPWDPIASLQDDRTKDDHLELVALATVADLVPLIGVNRILLKFGLQQLQKTQRIGLKALFQEAGIESEKLGVYEIGHIIAPRLNAMGRLEHAMDSLRLLCTNNRERAKKLAQILGNTNRERQELTIATVEHAKSKIKNQKSKVKSLLFISHETYQQGVIGLVAGKLVEEFYRPSIVVSIGERYSKASARSVAGFNIVEFIRTASEMLIDVGGHPMAAGFTVETVKLAVLKDKLLKKSEELLDKELLTRTLKIDCEIKLTFVNESLYGAIQKLSPFGMGNPEPTFVSRNVVIEGIRIIGKDGKHLKLRLGQQPLELSNRHSGEEERRLQNLSGSFMVNRDSGRALLRQDSGSLARMTRSFDAIAFGMGERFSEFHIGDKVDIVYTIDENDWNGSKKLQLKIKDIRLSRP